MEEKKKESESEAQKPKECFTLKNKGLEKIATCKNNNYSKKSSKFNNNFSFKIDSLTNNTNTNKTHIINLKNKNVMNTYKTFSEISTKQNDTKKTDNSINTINIYNNKCSNNNNTHYLLIEEENFRINNNNKIHKENGIFNGDRLYFDESGLKYGLRGKKDGYGFFGIDTHYHGKIINDYVLNINNGIKKQDSSISYNSNTFNDDKNNNIPVLYFAIYYEKENNKFYLKSLRKINYNNLESFAFSFGIYQKYVCNCLKIKENMIINFNENQNYSLSLQPINASILRVYLIKIDRIDNETNNYSKNSIIYKSKIQNNGVSKIIGKKGNIKIDLQGKNYLLSYNKKENYWEIKSNSKKKENFWIMVDKEVELIKENIFKVSSQFFKIIYK